MNTTGIAYIEFKNVSVGAVASYLPLLQLALTCILRAPVHARWMIEKTASSNTLYDDITLPYTNLTDCANATWPTYQTHPTSLSAVGVNYEISTLTPDILTMNLVEFNTLIAKGNQTQSVASLLGSPYFFSAAPVQLLHLPTATYNPDTSSADLITISFAVAAIAFIAQSIV